MKERNLNCQFCKTEMVVITDKATWICGKCEAPNVIIGDSSKNNGGETDYYAIPSGFTTHQDVIEQRDMNYAQGNIYKVACTFNVGRHSGTDYERDLNKIIFFAKRELERISNAS